MSDQTPVERARQQFNSPTVSTYYEMLCSIQDLLAAHDALTARCEALEQEKAEALTDAAIILERAEAAELRCDCHIHADQTCDICAGLSGPDGDKTSAVWKADYERACQTIAAMHAAAVGDVTGPKRGVVEDVADLYVRCEALIAERDTLRQKLSEADEIRVSFAAGYTAALDDAMKGTK